MRKQKEKAIKTKLFDLSLKETEVIIVGCKGQDGYTMAKTLIRDLNENHIKTLVIETCYPHEYYPCSKVDINCGTRFGWLVNEFIDEFDVLIVSKLVKNAHYSIEEVIKDIKINGFGSKIRTLIVFVSHFINSATNPKDKDYQADMLCFKPYLKEVADKVFYLMRTNESYLDRTLSLVDVETEKVISNWETLRNAQQPKIPYPIFIKAKNER